MLLTKRHNGCEFTRPRRAIQRHRRSNARNKCKRRRYNKAPKARVGCNERLGCRGFDEACVALLQRKLEVLNLASSFRSTENWMLMLSEKASG